MRKGTNGKTVEDLKSKLLELRKMRNENYLKKKIEKTKIKGSRVLCMKLSSVNNYLNMTVFGSLMRSHFWDQVMNSSLKIQAKISFNLSEH